MTKWERLEEWINDQHTLGGAFTNRDVAKGLRVSRRDATSYVRSYLDAQRAQTVSTLYVLHREGRTSRAVWIVGVATRDARSTSHQYFDDVKQRFKIALAPDLVRIAELNPRAAKRCERIIEAVGDGAMTVLRVAVDGIEDE